jgi:RNA polymerase sigma factor (sigma-70 family)
MKRYKVSGEQSSVAATSKQFERLADSQSNAVAITGREVGFEALWRLYSTRVMRTAYRITNNREDAEDALQDAFLKAYLHLQDFDGRSSFVTWLTRIAINSALTILRKRRSAQTVSIDEPGNYGEPGAADIPDLSLSPEVSYAQREREQMLSDGISALQPTTRHAVELRKLQGHSLAETAKMMGLSVNAAKTRIYRAKAALRKSMKSRLANPLQESR